MLQPVGPLPPAVYWRRRALTLAVLLAALALLIGVVLAVSTSNAAPSAPSASTPSSTGAGPSNVSAGPFAALDTSVTAKPADSAADAATTTDAPAAPTTGAPVPTTEAPPPAAPTDCPDTAIKVVASAGQPSYPVGGKPVVVLSVVNVGPVACVRDLDAAKQEILMYAGTTRIWSSNDCYPGSFTDVRTLLPQEMAQYTVEWSGLASAPGCVQPRAAVGAGSYSIVARLDAVQSEPAVLVLT